MTKPKFYWFAPTNGDGERLGLSKPEREPTLDYLVNVAKAVEEAGFEGILIPTGIPYLDSFVVGSAIIHHTDRIKPLIALRPGFISPTVASKLAATLDQFSSGRLLVNVVTGGSKKELSQDGDFANHEERYRRTEEFLDVLVKSWNERHFKHQGEFFNINDGLLYPPLYQEKGIPVHFGGSSHSAKKIAAKYANVYLQWGEPVARIKEQIEDVRKQADELERTVDFGIRLHVVIRNTEEEAWNAAYEMISSIDTSVQQKMNDIFEESDSVAQKRMTEISRQGERFDKYSLSLIHIRRCRRWRSCRSRWSPYH